MLTQEQLDDRRNHLGASDMAAVLNQDKWRNAYDLWLEKTGRAEPPDISQKKPVVCGVNLEEGVLQWAANELQDTIEHGVYRELAGNPLAANLDGLTKAGRLPVEAKVSGVVGPLTDEWGREDTDEVPEMYIVQVHAQMACCVDESPERAYLAALLGGRGFRLYEIQRNQELCDLIVEAAARFWSDFVEADTPPPDLVPSLDVVKHVRRSEGKVADIDPFLLEELDLAKDNLKRAKKDVERAQAAVLAAMGDAEAANAGDAGAVTYKEQHRDGYTVEPTSFRVLRRRKNPIPVAKDEEE